MGEPPVRTLIEHHPCQLRLLAEIEQICRSLPSRRTLPRQEPEQTGILHIASEAAERAMVDRLVAQSLASEHT